MKVFVIIGYNGILDTYGPIGVCKSKDSVNKILERESYMLDDYKVFEMEVED